MRQLEPRPCPVCLSTKAREVLYHQQFFEGPLGNGYDVCVCEYCGAGFADGVPNQGDLDRYYAERSKYTYAHNDGAESPFDVKRFKAIADQLEPHLQSKDASIIDIGCATGGLLAELKRRGYTSLLGSDPSPECCKTARELHGLQIITRSLGALPGLEQRFDAVIMVGVLEHIHHLRAALDTARGLLRHDGILFCAQPDAARFAETSHAPFQQFSVEHINYFTSEALRNAAGLSGLKLVCCTQWMVEWRTDLFDSVVTCVFAKNGVVSPVKEADARLALKGYIEQSTRREKPLLDAVERLCSRREPVYIWGVGTQTRRLMAVSRLRSANILGFVDSDPFVAGSSFGGAPVLNPGQLCGTRDRIIIGSTAFYDEIAAAIRFRYKLDNPISGWVDYC